MSTAIVAKDSVLGAVAQRVIDVEDDHEKALARERQQKAIAVRTTKIFIDSLMAKTSNEEDHERFLALHKEARAFAVESVMKKSAKIRGESFLDLDCPQTTSKKQRKPRKPASNRGMTGLSMHNMHNKKRITGFVGQDVMVEMTGLYKECLSKDDQGIYDDYRKGYVVFWDEKGIEDKKEAKKAWLALGQDGWDPYLKQVTKDGTAPPLPDVPPRGSGGAWDERWARRITNMANDKNQDDADDDDDALDDDDH
jgi:hypothetical protein